MLTLRPFTLPNGWEVLQVDAAETSLQFRNIFTNRRYCHQRLALPRTPMIADIGANVGIASLFFAWAFPGAQILAVEPVAALFEALRHNLHAHGVDARTFRCAIGGARRNGMVYLYPHANSMSSLYLEVDEDVEVTRTFLRNSGFSPSDVADMLSGRHVVDEQPCEIVTLSELIDTEQLPRIDLLKLNVEKAELEVLDGIRENHWPRVGHIVMQVHDIVGRVDLIRERLESRGYDVTLDQDPLLVGTNILELFAFRRRATEQGRA